MIRKFTPSWAAIAAFGLLCGPAYAQATGQGAGNGGAGNVNECTLLPDPTELRNCILRFEGQRTPPPTTLESGTEAEGRPVAAGDGSASAAANAAPLPAAKADKRRSPKLPVTAASERRPVEPKRSSEIATKPRADKGEIWVEQIKISKSH